MAFQDPRGVPLTSGSAESVSAYEEALDQILGFAGDPVGVLERLVERDPACVQAHLAKAAIYAWALHPSFVGRAREALDAARKAGPGLEHERRQAAAVEAWLDGRYSDAGREFDALLAAQPRHLTALFFAHQADFFAGRTGALEARPRRTLEALSADQRGRGFVLGMWAFGLEENGRFAAAEEAGREAVAAEPRDVWAIHAVGHVLEETGRSAEGIRWYGEREPDWAENSYFAVHNAWHLALHHLDREETGAVLAVYDRFLTPGRRSILLNLCDSAALLWRLHLAGIAVGDRWGALAEAFAAKYRPGCHVFDDIHAMFAFVGAGETGLAARLMADLAVIAEGGDDRARQLRRAGLPICRAIAAFGRGDWGAAVDLLSGLGENALLMTGSRAQRDILELTLIEAGIRAGDGSLARDLLERRLERKPESRRIRRDLERISA